MATREGILEYMPQLRRYARALTGNRELAEDLVQDTLERGLRYGASFRPGTDLRAWLKSIMHNVFLNDVKKLSSRMSHVPIDDDEFQDDALIVNGAQVHCLELRDLDSALQSLPKGQREVLLLVGLEEMSYAEVSQTLQIPVGTVMSRLSRGRERLRVLTGSVCAPKQLIM